MECDNPTDNERHTTMTDKPSDILNRAAEIMLERGHHKGDFVDPDTGRVCLYGAFDAACNELNAPYIGAHYIAKAIDGAHIPVWNDRPETTEAMAIGVLHDAAVLAKEAGQ
jgi:hypothetical protein